MNQFSFVIPLHNEEKFIGQCLSSLITTLKDSDISYEIIVVDNNSIDNSYKIAQEYPVTLVQVAADRPSIVRNYGASLANSTYLTFIDGDCVVDNAWLNNILSTIEREDVGACGGPCVAPTTDNWVVTSWNPTQLKSSFSEKSKLPGANITIKSDVFKQIGGFDESLISAEDDAISKAVMKAGYLCVSDSAAVIIHLGYPNSLVDIVKKQIWHGSTQISSHGWLGDKMTLATMVWLMSFVGLIFLTSIYPQPFAALVPLAGVFGIPILFLLNRLKSHRNISLKKLVLGYVVAAGFVLGRAIGFVKEVRTLLTATAK